MPERDPLDLLIDSALATYAEPPAGLEDRVLRACATAPFQPQPKSRAFPVRRVLPWFVALGTAACMLVALLIHNHPTAPPSQANTSAAPHVQPGPVPPVIATSRVPRPPRAAQSQSFRQPVWTAAQQIPAPKLDVFPTPEPLTPQEQALVAFIARASRPKLDALLAAQQQINEPLSIPAIQIQPLELPDQGNR